MQAEQNLFVALPSASLQLLGSSVLGEFSECLVESGFAEWFHLRVSRKIAVKMWAGSVSSEGLIKLKDPLPKWLPHMAVDRRPQCYVNLFIGLLGYPHNMAADFPQSK